MNNTHHNSQNHNNQRPLSPHIQIYRWQLTMILSILHRATGMVLCLGTIGLSLVIMALAAGPDAYGIVQSLFATVMVKLILFGWTACFYYHLGNGVRHLVWDAGYGYSIKSSYRSGYFVLGFSAVLTLLTWMFALEIIFL